MKILILEAGKMDGLMSEDDFLLNKILFNLHTSA